MQSSISVMPPWVDGEGFEIGRAERVGMDDEKGEAIIVRSVKIDGHSFDEPLPRFEYEVKIGKWTIIVESEKDAEFMRGRDGQKVEVEVVMHFGTLRDVGVVKTWQAELAGGPAFTAKIVGNDPMHFVER